MHGLRRGVGNCSGRSEAPKAFSRGLHDMKQLRLRLDAQENHRNRRHGNKFPVVEFFCVGGKKNPPPVFFFPRGVRVFTSENHKKFPMIFLWPCPKFLCGFLGKNSCASKRSLKGKRIRIVIKGQFYVPVNRRLSRITFTRHPDWYLISWNESPPFRWY
jgi:hypothetical protein